MLNPLPCIRKRTVFFTCFGDPCILMILATSFSFRVTLYCCAQAVIISWCALQIWSLKTVSSIVIHETELVAISTIFYHTQGGKSLSLTIYIFFSYVLNAKCTLSIIQVMIWLKPVLVLCSLCINTWVILLEKLTCLY